MLNPLMRVLLEKRVHDFISEGNDKLIEASLVHSLKKLPRAQGQRPRGSGLTAPAGPAGGPGASAFRRRDRTGPSPSASSTRTGSASTSRPGAVAQASRTTGPRRSPTTAGSASR